MSSLIPGFEYDIFISYRQKDNRGERWVSEFVESLKTELESTFKEEISVYFDIDPHDGLLETHDVDASLKEKLKCLVFIPVISRTYCDPKSFAWEHEFKAFVKEATVDRYGIKIKLPDGNVSSRVLPVRIHDLDNDDIKLCESLLGGYMRGVEFIYKEPGVNKPLASEDDEKKNLNKTKYRIQINKTANAIKEIISGIIAEDVAPDKVEDKSESVRKAIVDEKNIKRQKTKKRAIWIGSITANIIFILIIINALKPFPFEEKDWILITDFENQTADSAFDQSLNTALEVSIQQSSFVNVFPRTRIYETLKRMGKEKTELINEDTGVEIAQREGIPVIITCGINLVGNTYMLTGKVVEVSSRKTIKTETFQADGKDEILSSLDGLARKIRRDLGESLKEINDKILPLPEATTSSVDALKLLVRGREAWSRDGKPDEAEIMFLKAIELDSSFALAHVHLGSLYYWWNNRLKGEEHFTKALGLSGRLTEKEKLYIEARVEGFRGNYDGAILKYNVYLRSYPSSSEAWYSLGYSYMMSDRYMDAIEAFNKSLDIYKDKDPNAFINIASCYSSLNKNLEANEYYLKAFALNPKLLLVPNLNHEFGINYIQMDEFEKAREVYEKMLQEKDDQKARGYRSLALLSMYRGRFSEAISYLKESILINKTLKFYLSELRDRLFLASIYKTRRMVSEYNGELNKVNILLQSEGMQPGWFLYYGKFRIRDGNIQESEKVLNEISARSNEGNKSDQAAFNLLKGEIELAKRDTVEAHDLLKTTVRLRKDAYTLESLANYYNETGNLDKAISTCCEIIKINSAGWEAQQCWIDAHYILGKLYEEKGNRELAVKYYNDFINIWKDADPDIPDLNEAKSRLAKLQNQ